MIIESLTPTGEHIETINLDDCFNHRHAYKRYKIFTQDGTYMLTPETCYQIMGLGIEDNKGKPKPFKFK